MELMPLVHDIHIAPKSTICGAGQLYSLKENCSSLYEMDLLNFFAVINRRERDLFVWLGYRLQWNIFHKAADLHFHSIQYTNRMNFKVVAIFGY